MNLNISQAHAHLDVLRNAADSKEYSAQGYKVALSEILPYSNISNHAYLEDVFALKPTANAFLENAKAYGFEFGGVNCAYVMTQVLNIGEHSLWLAIEIHQYKDSWGLDAGEISWLYLRNQISGSQVGVTDLRLLPLKVFTDYEDVEVSNALTSISEDFLDYVDVISAHSRIIQNKFSSNTSMQWIRELTTLGYTLTQFSPVKIQHAQTKIDIRNALVPYLLEVNGTKYKAMSLLERMDSNGVVDSFWLSFLMNKEGGLNLEEVIVSFGQYAADLTICKAPSRLVVENSAIFNKNNFANGDFLAWLDRIGVSEDKRNDFYTIVKGALNYDFDNQVIERIMFRCEFDENEVVSVSDLNFEDDSELITLAELNEDAKFSGNVPLYFSTSSYPTLNYKPNEKYSLVDDFIQPVALQATPVVEEDLGESEFDHHQPDYNQEDKISQLFAKKKTTKPSFLNVGSPTFSHHSRSEGRRERGYSERQSVDVDQQIENAELNKRNKQQKQSPDVKKKYRFRMLLNKAKREENEKAIQETQHNLKQEGVVAAFINQVSHIPENANDVHDVTVESINDLVKQKAEGKLTEETKQPARRGRPPKVNSEPVETAVEEQSKQPTRRGRKPKPKVEVVDQPQVEAKAEPVTETEVKQPARRGRPPKVKSEPVVTAVEEQPKQPVKRGRKPKPKVEVAAQPQVEAKAEPVFEPVEAAVEEQPKQPAKRGRKPKPKVEVATQPKVEAKAEPVEEPVKAAEKTQVDAVDEGLSIFTEDFEIKVSDQIFFKDNKVGVSASYPKNLISDNANYLLNSFIAHGVDKFEAVNVLTGMGCKFMEYTFHELQRKLEKASEDELAKYLGFENYITECEYELFVRK